MPTDTWLVAGLLVAVVAASIGTVSQSSATQGPPATRVQAAATTPLAPLSVRRVSTAWIPWWDLSAGVASVTNHPALFADVSPYWYRATGSSNVIAQDADQPSEATLISAINTLHTAGTRVLPTVSDFGLDSKVMARLLKDSQRRTDLVHSLSAMVERTGSDGVDIDFEAMNFPAGPQRAVISRKFPIFLRQLEAALHRDNDLLAVSLPPRTSDADSNWSIYDYSDFAPYVDRVRLLTYDYSYAGSDPGPVAPIQWVDKVTRYAKSEFGRLPISVGQPAYGYNWFIKKLSGTCTPSMGVRHTFVPTSQQALALVDSYNADLKWDKSSAESYFTYRKPYSAGTDHCTVLRKVWFEAARSVESKLAILRDRNVQGFAIWSLGVEDPRTWGVLHRFAEHLNPKPASAQLNAPDTVSAGDSVSLAGRFRVGGLPVQGADVAVQRRVRGGDWTAASSVVTTATGRAVFDVVPDRTYQWRMRLPAAWDWANTFTATRLVAVQ